MNLKNNPCIMAWAILGMEKVFTTLYIFSKFLVPGSTIIGYNITNPTNANIVVATGIDPSAKKWL
jgi:hypothetical protein